MRTKKIILALTSKKAEDKYLSLFYKNTGKNNGNKPYYVANWFG